MLFGNYLQSLYVCEESLIDGQVTVIDWDDAGERFARDISGRIDGFFFVFFLERKREPVWVLGRIAAQMRFSTFSAVELLGITGITPILLINTDRYL